MTLYVLFALCLALGVFLYMKHKQNEREVNRRERLEDKQEQMMERLRNRKKENDTEN